MKHLLAALWLAFLIACNNDKTTPVPNSSESSSAGSSSNKSGHWEGGFSNGLKGATISFDISEDGKELKDLTFQGYWRCEGKLDLTTLGPEKSFTIQNNKVDGVIIEPENGAAPFRFELHGSFTGDSAEGSFRISNVPAGCDTYMLNWSAKKK